MIVVTRHPSLVALLEERGIVPAGTQAVPTATPELIRGQHVVGVLPLHLAAEADRVTVVPLSVPPELRGQELSLGQLREFAGEAATYKVSRVSDSEAR